MTHYPKFFSNNRRILALWVMYAEKVTKNLVRALPPLSFGQNPKEQHFFPGNLP